MGSILRISLLVFFLAFYNAWSQDTAVAAPKPQRVRAADRAAALREPELQEVKIEGCTLTTPSQILGVIDSRESDLTLTRRFTRYFYNNLRRNPATPKPVLRTLGDIQRDRLDELRYYNSKTVQSDSFAILEYLNQNGFHTAQVRTQFARDSASRKNVLTFYLNEGPQAVVDTIFFYGLEQVPDDVRQKVMQEFTVKKGDPYSEAAIDENIRGMIIVLRNNGYYRARLAQIPTWSTSDDSTHDSLGVAFETDVRVRIGRIILDYDENGYRAVDTSTRKRQLEIEEGQWYSEEKIAVSRANLLSLNTFESVTIDTLPRCSARSHDTIVLGDTIEFFDGTTTRDSIVTRDSLVTRPCMPSFVADSIVWVRVFTKNGKPYDVGANVFVYQTAIDNFVNAGIGANAQYRNLFGVADVAGANAQYVLQDVSRLFQGQTVETESLFSLSYAVPHWARINSLRVGAQGTTYYSRRNLVSTFKLESFGASLKLPITAYTFNVVNSGELNITLERQIPLDFIDTYQTALDNSRTSRDSQNVISTFITFSQLNRYLNEDHGLLGFLTGIFIGGVARAEHRDIPLDPTKGYFLSLSGEYGTGAGNFLKLQLFNTTISSITKKLIAATKFNLGHIFLLRFERGTTEAQNQIYVPLDRQFFAGGASSIRSYASRQLHDKESGTISDTDPGLTAIQNNILGSGTLFELGFELRYSFTRPEGVTDLIAGIVEKSGITWFTDFGNAFNRLTTELYGTAQLADFINNSVLAMGLGYRFATPVGPFRLDLATSIYDPSKSHPFIVNRPNALGFENLQLSIGLGHAF